MSFTQSLIDCADKIDNRLGPISGKDADALAVLLRDAVITLNALFHKQVEHNRAIYDATGETARCVDELAFWRYQAIWARAYMLDPQSIKWPLMEDGQAWKEATLQLEAARTDENRKRYAHAEEPRDPGAS